MDLDRIQAALQDAKLDGWLFYDHHHRDPIAYRVLGIAPAMVTRRWYYLIPAAGEPAKLLHRIEKGNLAGLPGAEHEYSSWTEQREKLKAILAGQKTVAMQYSPLNDILYVGLVDAGTIELVRSLGVEVVSSGDLVQLFEARWSPAALASHLEAGRGVHAAVRQGFTLIRDAILSDKPIGEYDVQQGIARALNASALAADEAPIVAVNANSSRPHYSPSQTTSRPILPGDFVLLDVWAKQRIPGAVYFDITWTGFVGEEVPRRGQGGARRGGHSGRARDASRHDAPRLRGGRCRARRHYPSRLRRLFRSPHRTLDRRRHPRQRRQHGQLRDARPSPDHSRNVLLGGAGNLPSRVRSAERGGRLR